MRVTVTSLVDAKAGLVGFTTQYGDGLGHWQGTLPKLGLSYEVELSVDAVLRSGRDLAPVHSGATPMIRVMDGGTELVGQLIDVGEDGVAVVQLGDSVLMLDMEGRAVSVPVWVKVGPVQLDVHDTGV